MGIAGTTRPLWWKRSCQSTGEWLRSSVPPIDAVLCSTAARTRETLTRTGLDVPVTFDERLYDAVPGTVIDVINGVDDGVATLLVIGHEPAMSNVAIGLAGAPGSSQAAAERISTKFPTSAIAVLRTDAPWRDLTMGAAILVTFHVAR